MVVIVYIVVLYCRHKPSLTLHMMQSALLSERRLCQTLLLQSVGQREIQGGKYRQDSREQDALICGRKTHTVGFQGRYVMDGD